MSVYNQAFNVWSLGKLVSFVFLLDARENKAKCFPRDHTLSVY